MTIHSHSAILIVGPSWVGDMVMAQSLFKILKREHFDVNIDVLAPKWSSGFLKRMPEVRSIIDHDIEHGELAWKKRRDIGQLLRRQHYQQAIVLPNSWKSALIPFWAGIPKRIGYLGEMRYGLLNDIRILDKVLLPRTVDRFVALGLDKYEPYVGHTTPIPLLSPRHVEQALQHLNLTFSEKPLLVLCPGAEYGRAKRWFPTHFATVAKEKIKQGWQVWILGSEKEMHIGLEIERLAGEGCRNLCGETRLSEAVDLMALATAVVTNDSGLMHVAAALDKPMIAIYGSSSPHMTPPLNNHEHAHTLYLGLKCSPCFKRECRYKRGKKHLKCLRDITPEQVLELLDLYT